MFCFQTDDLRNKTKNNQPTHQSTGQTLFESYNKIGEEIRLKTWQCKYIHAQS